MAIGRKAQMLVVRGTMQTQLILDGEEVMPEDKR
jgi:hypothetical protein